MIKLEHTKIEEKKLLCTWPSGRGGEPTKTLYPECGPINVDIRGKIFYNFHQFRDFLVELFFLQT